MSHLVKKEDLQDYIQSLAVKRGCPVDNIDKTKAHWDLIMHRTTCMEAIRVYKGYGKAKAAKKAKNLANIM